jgi:hypothetical protein
VMAIFALIVCAAAALAVSLLVPGLKHRFRHAPAIVGAVIAVGTFAILTQTRATDRIFGGYFSFKTPRERFHDHFADFEEQVIRDPEIDKAIGAFPEASIMLQDLATRGVPRLDDATLRRRARIMGVLLSRLRDRPCVCVLHRASPTKSDAWEVETAMLNLEAGFVSEWMQVLHESMLAEVRKAPIPALSSEEMAAAYHALEAKIGVDPARRVAAGLREGAPDSECCWAGKTIYQMAPTMPEPHATVLLRMMAQAE